MVNKIQKLIFNVLIKMPIGGRFNNFWYSKLGVQLGKSAYIASDVKIIGNYQNLKLGNKTEVRPGSMLIAYDKITIGDNTAIAYGVMILTSSEPGGNHNSLYKYYSRIKMPVYIGQNSWIGARAIIFPGVTIGDCCVIAAGSVVTKNVPDYSVVAGVPASIVKQLNPEK